MQFFSLISFWRQIACEWRAAPLQWTTCSGIIKMSFTTTDMNTCGAHVVLNLLWHCNLSMMWLTDSALSFPSWWPCLSVKAYQPSFGFAVYLGWMYKLNESFMHADWWSCLSGLFLYMSENLGSLISTDFYVSTGRIQPNVCHTCNQIFKWHKV